MGIPSITDPREKFFVAKNGSFLEKEFLAKGVSSRKVEHEEVIEPSLHGMASGAAPEVVSELTSPDEERANDNYHETLKEDTTESPMLSRTHAAP